MAPKLTHLDLFRIKCHVKHGRFTLNEMAKMHGLPLATLRYALNVPKKIRVWVKGLGRTGRPKKERKSKRATLKEYYWAFVYKTPHCWFWLGREDDDGYGDVNLYVLGRGTVKAHRLAWELDRGITIPDGKIIAHRCDVPNCVNPKHLRATTHLWNIRDASFKGRLGKFGRKRRHLARPL